MLRFETTKRVMVRWFTSVPFYVLLGLILGGLISIPVIPQPRIAVITISSAILEQAYADDILDKLRHARENDSIKAVVLGIDSPGGGASATEQTYLEILRLREQKPVVASVGTMAASGGYYIAVASNFIYSEPTSQIGNIGAWVRLPQPEKLDEDVITSGPFKATYGSRRKTISGLATLKQQFVTAVMSQRGDRLKLSADELSQAVVYTGVESLRYGLIDDIGTSTDAIAKAASLAGIRNYEVVKLPISRPTFWFFGIEALKSQTSTLPVYYYLHFELE